MRYMVMNQINPLRWLALAADLTPDPLSYEERGSQSISGVLAFWLPSL